ncbi:hypothetical protein KSB_37370 [Ktedonobacter robiniae]|uniref:RRXRR domain-containing protein n=1 Tax=Ktedonobacter robiniae TaxID=2778365 RepID=A0ABQ3URN2_9CHLR|nr:hypothetical protein KSB_37370 [Ktedonobacter robiniae]
MSYVFVVDTDRHPLNPVHPGRARILLSSGKAAVLKRYPFTIVLKTSVEQPLLTPLRLKLDPGSNTTGIALVNDQSGKEHPMQEHNQPHHPTSLKGRPHSVI